MSSRSKPYVRSCLKIRPLLDALAREVESGSGHKDHVLANFKLVAPYRRFAIAALLADLTLEHRMLVLKLIMRTPTQQLLKSSCGRSKIDAVCCSRKGRY